MSAISTDKTSTPLVNAKKELPIIEYSFIDQRIQHKKELIIKSLKEIQAKKKEGQEILQILKAPVFKKGNKHEHDLNDPESKKKETPKLSKKIIKKNLAANRKTLARVLVEEAMTKNDSDIGEKAKAAVAKVESRGARNRLKRKLGKLFPSEVDAFKEIKEGIAK